jgi:hypothetical protein
LEKIQEIRERIHQFLDEVEQRAREEDLLDPNEILQVNIQISILPRYVVTLDQREQTHHAAPKGHNGYSAELTEEEWTLLLDLKLPEIPTTIIKTFHQNNNDPMKGDALAQLLGLGKFYSYSDPDSKMNRHFRGLQMRFRLRDGRRGYQIFKY